jgi:hypothetical protein
MSTSGVKVSDVAPAATLDQGAKGSVPAIAVAPAILRKFLRRLSKIAGLAG